MSQVNSNLIKTNSFTGKTAAGTITVTGEGGSTTTNLQQEKRLSRGMEFIWHDFSTYPFQKSYQQNLL